jgi:mannose-6-phosphate isomerase class I
VEVGPHPETFFGVHPSIVEKKQFDILLPYLVEWNNDLILRHSRAYLLVPGEGFHLPAGGLHAPGTALTIELQEDSDVFAFF